MVAVVPIEAVMVVPEIVATIIYVVAPTAISYLNGFISTLSWTPLFFFSFHALNISSARDADALRSLKLSQSYMHAKKTG